MNTTRKICSNTFGTKSQEPSSTDGTRGDDDEEFLYKKWLELKSIRSVNSAYRLFIKLNQENIVKEINENNADKPGKKILK